MNTEIQELKIQLIEEQLEGIAFSIGFSLQHKFISFNDIGK